MLLRGSSSNKGEESACLTLRDKVGRVNKSVNNTTSPRLKLVKEEERERLLEFKTIGIVTRLFAFNIGGGGGDRMDSVTSCVN